MLTPSALAFSCCSVAWTDCEAGWEGDWSGRSGECVSESSMSPGVLEVDFRGMFAVCTARFCGYGVLGRSEVGSDCLYLRYAYVVTR